MKKLSDERDVWDIFYMGTVSLNLAFKSSGHLFLILQFLSVVSVMGFVYVNIAPSKKYEKRFYMVVRMTTYLTLIFWVVTGIKWVLKLIGVPRLPLVVSTVFVLVSVVSFLIVLRVVASATDEFFLKMRGELSTLYYRDNGFFSFLAAQSKTTLSTKNIIDSLLFPTGTTVQTLLIEHPIPPDKEYRLSVKLIAKFILYAIPSLVIWGLFKILPNTVFVGLELLVGLMMLFLVIIIPSTPLREGLVESQYEIKDTKPNQNISVLENLFFFSKYWLPGGYFLYILVF